MAARQNELIDSVRRALSAIEGPGGVDVVTSGMVQDLTVHNGHAWFALAIPPSAAKLAEPLRLACQDAASRVSGIKAATATLTHHRGNEVRIEGSTVTPKRAGVSSALMSETQPRAGTAEAIPGIKAVIAVASGKGGVGKSTVAVNLALGLSRLGLRTGLLDADIYGPSVPHLLAIKERPQSLDGKKLEPIIRHGVKAMSIGMLVDVDTPMIWRGPMVMSALTQMLNDVNWGELDVLVVDMPPGTGDAQLTMAQRVPLKGAVIVSTPQDIALIDARKGLAMFRKTAVPVLGIVENMSTYICPNCGHEAHIFGHGGARKTAAELDCPFLGEIPLDLTIRELSDAGTPVVAAAPQSRQAASFMALAEKIAVHLKSEGSGASRPAPRIIIEE
ncbi:MAG TPA: iron-sulfur cluster carrier protein ApbC [Micropepsaceae bacterium]|nr:iron-sulfur cluster carrier protein ApbC [Micropepsaceae bacterium]